MVKTKINAFHDITKIQRILKLIIKVKTTNIKKWIITIKKEQKDKWTWIIEDTYDENITLDWKKDSFVSIDNERMF